MTYEDVREQMRPGDCIAFGGKGRVSGLIKAFTRSPVSHVGTILRAQSLDEESPRYFVLLAESTSLGGVAGVRLSRLSVRLRFLDGQAWWLPLREELRARLDVSAFTSFLFEAEGKPYDTLQAIGAALDLLVEEQAEDFGAFFCSELCAGALNAGGLELGNASEITPVNLVRMPLWQPAVQLAGEPRPIP